MQFWGRRSRREASRRGRWSAIAAFLTLVLAACSGGVVLEPTEGPVVEARKIAQAAEFSSDTLATAAGNPGEIALESSKLFFESAQVVVLASATERSAIFRAASVAITLGTPLLLTAPPGQNLSGDQHQEITGSGPNPGSLNTELLRLGTRALLTVGEVSLHQLDTTSLVVQPIPDDDEDLAKLLDLELTSTRSPAPADAMRLLADLEVGEIYDTVELGPPPEAYGTLPETLPAVRNEAVTVLTGTNTRYYAGGATARAAGARVLTTDDPASQSETVTYFATHPSRPVVGMGEDFLDGPRLERLVNSMRAGDLLPTGAQKVFRADGEAVTVVGLEATRALETEGIDDAHDVAREAGRRAGLVADGLGGPTVAAVAVETRRSTMADLDYWLLAAREAGIYLTLIIRPTDQVVEDIRAFEHLLANPEVGLQIDASHQAEFDTRDINDVGVYLRRIVREENLPQKLFILDLGSETTVTNAESLTILDRELALAIAVADGAEAHWRNLHAQLPAVMNWAVTLEPVPVDAEDEDEPPEDYPDLRDILGAGAADLLVFR